MASEYTISIEARPALVTLDLRQTAVLVIDMQNDFGSQGGMFDRAGKDIALIQAVVGPIKRVLSVARSAGLPVIYIKMEFRPDLSNLGGWSLCPVGELITAPDGSEGRILIEGTWNTAIVEELTPQDGDIVVSKQRFSGFYGTELDTILKTLGVTTLIFTGCTTSICVESTLRDAAFRDYRCILLADCTAEPTGSDLPRTNHDATLSLIEEDFGSVSDSASFAKAFASQPVAASTQ